jgi:hypothetical protein
LPQTEGANSSLGVIGSLFAGFYPKVERFLFFPGPIKGLIEFLKKQKFKLYFHEFGGGINKKITRFDKNDEKIFNENDNTFETTKVLKKKYQLKEAKG